MNRRREESVTLMVVALSASLAAWSLFWMGATGGSVVAWHLVALCVGRSWFEPLPLTVLIIPSAILWTILGDLSPLAVILPLALALALSTAIATSEFLPGRLAGAGVVLLAVALAGSLLRPLGAVWMEAAIGYLAAGFVESSRSGFAFVRSWRRPTDALGGYGT